MKKYTLYIILLVIILIIVSLQYSIYIEPFESNNIMVISHYNEDLSYLNTEPFSNYNHIIYTKGENSPNFKNDKIIKLPNVGVCVHTYLQYIIDNYDSLPDISIFLPGSCMDNHKKNMTLNTISKVEKTNNSVFYVNKVEDVKKELYNFTLDEWKNTNINNQELNSDTKLRKSEIRPFGKWYEKYFTDIIINGVNYGGIFAVSREHIRNRSKESYKELINLVNKDKNEETAHYFERAFLALFHPIPDYCIYK